MCSLSSHDVCAATASPMLGQSGHPSYSSTQVIFLFKIEKNTGGTSNPKCWDVLQLRSEAGPS